MEIMGCCTECDFKGYVETDLITGPYGWPEEEWTCPEEACRARNLVEDEPDEPYLRESSTRYTLQDLCLLAASD